MGKLTIRRKIILLMAGIFLAGLAMGFLVIVSEWQSDCVQNAREVQGQAKVLLNQAVYEANQGKLGKLNQYSYYLADVKGNIIQSNEEANPVGRKVNLALPGYNGNGIQYTTPQIINGTQTGTYFITIPKDELVERDWTVIITGSVFAIILLVLLIMLGRTLKVDIILPLREIHRVTNKIQRGNLEESVRYDYDSEVGALCHDFEEMRAQLKFSTENEQKLKEKEKKLLAYISHDLRTPIASIAGYVEGIHSEIVKGNQVHEYTEAILKKIKMLDGLIDDILEQSKAQVGELSINKKECYAREYFSAWMEEAKQDCENAGLAFTCNEIPQVLVSMDSKRMQQVVQNLIGNAMKFTKEGGITVTFAQLGGQLQVIVKDTGMGIAAGDLPFVFGEFYRGEKARTLNVPGSGLGLCISNYIVKAHGGHMECDSLLGKWTEIGFTIPVL